MGTIVRPTLISGPLVHSEALDLARAVSRGELGLGLVREAFETSGAEHEELTQFIQTHNQSFDPKIQGELLGRIAGWIRDNPDALKKALPYLQSHLPVGVRRFAETKDIVSIMKEELPQPKLELQLARTNGKTIGGEETTYKIIQKIDHEGQAHLFVVEDEATGQKHIAKKMNNTQDLGEMMRETRALKQLNHPDIVSLREVILRESDLGIQELFLIMEYVEGAQTFKEAIQSKRKFGEAELLDLMMKVETALEEAHRQGIIHRDIKPSNILLKSDGNIKLIDFGIAKFVGDRTRTGTLGVGTPNYMSPEQLHARKITEATDVYALGLTLLDLARGELRNPNDMYAMEKATATYVAQLKQARGTELSRAFLDGLEGMTNENPEKRMQALAAMKKLAKGETTIQVTDTQSTKDLEKISYAVSSFGQSLVIFARAEILPAALFYAAYEAYWSMKLTIILGGLGLFLSIFMPWLSFEEDRARRIIKTVFKTVKKVLPTPIVDNNAKIKVFLKTLPFRKLFRSDEENKKLDQVVLNQLPFFFALHPTIDQVHQLERHVHSGETAFAVKRAAMAREGSIKTPDDFLKIVSKSWLIMYPWVEYYSDYKEGLDTLILEKTEFFFGLHPTSRQIRKLVSQASESTGTTLLFKAYHRGLIKYPIDRVRDSL